MEESHTRLNGDVKVSLTVATLAAAGFLFRAYPHLLLIPRWIIEESYNYQTVRDLVKWGASPQAGFYPMLEHQLVYWIWLLTGISPLTLAQYMNPMLGALTIIPVYYVLRHGLTVRQSLLGCVLFAFSEAAYYRSTYFGSTEALGFLLASAALVFYQRKQPLFAAPTLVLAALGHLLPAVFIFGVIGLDQFITSSNRKRIIIIIAVVAVVAVFYSPLNPHQRLLSSLNPASLLTGFKVSNVGIYAVGELFGGVAIFGGLVLLCFAAAYSWMLREHVSLMDVYLFAAGGLFLFSWVDYQPNVFAPPRLTFYFLIPLIYYAVRVLDGKLVAVITFVSLLSAFLGTPMMLYTEDCMPLNEYYFLDSMNISVNGLSEWWTDYPLRVALTAEYNASPTIALNEADMTALGLAFLDPYSTMKPDTKFKYVLLTERMETRGFFFLYNDQRTIRVNKPVPDIWSSGENGWGLIDERFGVKLYERKTS